jgi:hypothetical protein
MALPASGNSISLNQMHTEVWGTSGDSVSLNDEDIRGMIFKDAQTQMSFSEWHGVTPPIEVEYVAKYHHTRTNNNAPTSTTMSLSNLSSNPTTLVVAAHWFDRTEWYHDPSSPSLSATGYTVNNDVTWVDRAFDEMKYLSWHRIYIGTATSVTLSGTRAGYVLAPHHAGWTIWECTGNLQKGTHQTSPIDYTETAGEWSNSSPASNTVEVSVNANERDVVFLSCIANQATPNSISNIDSGSQQTGTYSKFGYDTRGSGDSGSVTYTCNTNAWAGGGIAAVRYYLS